MPSLGGPPVWISPSGITAFETLNPRKLPSAMARLAVERRNAPASRRSRSRSEDLIEAVGIAGGTSAAWPAIKGPDHEISAASAKELGIEAT
jgi:hypothetical protein